MLELLWRFLVLFVNSILFVSCRLFSLHVLDEGSDTKLGLVVFFDYNNLGVFLVIAGIEEFEGVRHGKIWIINK